MLPERISASLVAEKNNKMRVQRENGQDLPFETSDASYNVFDVPCLNFLPLEG